MRVTPTAALQQLFIALFTPDELRRFLGNNTSRDVTSALPSQTSMANLAYEAVGVLERRGEVRPELFAALRAERPGRADEIDPVEQQWRNRR